MNKRLLMTAVSCTLIGALSTLPLSAQTPLTNWLAGGETSGLVIDQERGVLTMAPLIEQAKPGVVNIRVVSRKTEDMSALMENPFFRYFAPEDMQPRERSAVSAGSGVIVDARNGYILTNHHVAKDATEMMVTLKDGRTIEATFIGSDRQTDLALLQIDAENLSELSLGDSEELKVGDIVVAIGNPFGIGQTVTSGIVSGLERYGLSRDGYENFIQTDASINPGNSGGALINTKGELVGINTAIISRSGTSSGVGLAVPSNMANTVVNQLIKYGEVRRGRIGVSIQNLTPELAEGLGISGATKGALVSTVSEGSPAEKAGLRKGDVVVAFNGDPIESSRDLRNAVGFVEVDSKNNISYIRDGRRKTVKIDLEAITDDETSDRETDRREPRDDFEPSTFRGASIAPIPEGVDVSGGEDGIMIMRVEQGSQAERAGLRRGDIIRGVNNASVETVSNFNDLIEDEDGVVVLNVQRGRSEIFVAVKA